MPVSRVTTIYEPVLFLIFSRDSTILFKAPGAESTHAKDRVQNAIRGGHHALHASPVQQTGDILGCGTQVETLGEHRGVESVADGVECVGEGEMLDDDGIEHGHHRREQHDRNSWLPPR